MLDIVLILLSTLILSSLFLLYFSKYKSGGAPLPPGPRGWPILGNLPQLGTKPHHTLHALSKVYGPLFRLRFGSVDVVVAASASVASQFLRANDANFCDRPPNSGAEYVAYNYQDLVFAPYGSRWRELRKLCQVHLFSAKALDDLRWVREGEVGLLVRALGAAANSAVPVHLGQAVNVCATNALARATMGRRVFEETGGGEEAGEFKEMVVELMRLAGEFNVGDFVPWLRWLDPQGVVAKMKRLHRKYDEFLDKIIAEHRRVEGKSGKTSGGRDLLSTLIGLKGEADVDVDGEEGKLTDTNIKALLLNLFTAGTDTSSSTVEWALAELIRQPDVLRRAQHELDSVVGRGRLVSESDLPNLPLLQAIVKETFRLHPSTPLSLPRMASEACEVAGYAVPKGATLLVNIWAITHDPESWRQPLEFRPERFLPGGEREGVDLRGNDFELIPFGAGRRICAGMSLGIRMVQFMTATLVHAFEWGLPEGQVAEKLDMEEAYGLTLQRAVPLMVHPSPRLVAAAYEN
ncbi:flavonoid 3'-monooxygenase [Canna indica]|uniref:Flavonoid 3'-monooxygenase n=1 Tax=Canna indica TaxID=4628 RepID=A0AAQ3Q0H3_9LILI|nr:flavonoid 3'-monooxygenase [Canna indica]